MNEQSKTWIVTYVDPDDGREWCYPIEDCLFEEGARAEFEKLRPDCKILQVKEQDEII